MCEDYKVILEDESGKERIFRVPCEVYEKLLDEISRRQDTYLRGYLRDAGITHIEALKACLRLLVRFFSSLDPDGEGTLQEDFCGYLIERAHGGPVQEVLPLVEFMERASDHLWESFTEELIRRAEAVE